MLKENKSYFIVREEIDEPLSHPGVTHHNAVYRKILRFRVDRYMQSEGTKIRLLLSKRFDQDIHIETRVTGRINRGTKARKPAVLEACPEWGLSFF